MEHDIVCCHEQLQKSIHAVERDEHDREALEKVTETFLAIFDMIKMIMISKQDRYYGVFLMNLELRIDFSSYFDASVNIDAFPFQMTVNPLLIGLRSLSEMIYILCHEIEHIVLNHPADGIKYNPDKDPQIGFKLNIAMDASINDRLTMDSTANKFRVITQPEGAVTSGYLQEKFKIHIKQLQAFDYYFERIPDLGVGADGGYNIIFAQDLGNKEIITAQKRKGLICLPSWTTIDDADEVQSIIRRFVGDVCGQMDETMRARLPEHQKRVLEKHHAQPVVSWKRLLKRYIGTIPSGRRKTSTRLSRRQPERYDISGSVNNRIIRLVVAIDTSGSMSKETLERIMTEIFAMIGTRMCEVTVIECDAMIQRVYKARSVRDISYDIYGGGGTSFTPVIEYLNCERSFRDAVLIYFTDGMGEETIPRPLVSRMIWVLHNERCKLSVKKPYGEVLVMD